MFTKINALGINVRAMAQAEGAAFASSHLEDMGYRAGLTSVLRWANELVDNPKYGFSALNPDQKVAFVGFFCDGYFARVAQYDAQKAEEKRRSMKRRPAAGQKVKRMFATYYN
jgi:hypothetical protein